jgi:hypothetical protein
MMKSEATEKGIICEEETITFEENEEEPDLDIAPARRKIFTKASDPEIHSLYQKWQRGKLILQPEFQRYFVWDKKKASRLIESVLLSVPLPVIYLAEDPDSKEYVIDGQQRLTSFFSFFDGVFPPDKTPFKLTGLSVFKELNGKKYKELGEELQDKIQYYELRTITIKKESDPDLKFEIFERLNTGSVPLNDMEIRNCVYRGLYIEFLHEMAKDDDFRYLMGLDKPHPRMRDVELVLRFASFYHATYLKYQFPMRRFFNRDMEKYQYISKNDTGELKKAFKNSVTILRSLFGQNAFRRYHTGTEGNPNGEWETKQFNASLFDVWMNIFCDKDKNRVFACLDSLREGLLDLMSTNGEFIDAIMVGTSANEKVKKRFDLARKVVEEILAVHPHQPRCFSFEIKKKLYDKNPTCAICSQHIDHIDDAAVDHIHQYWMGGKTIDDNARLAHRYCNWARSRKE